MKRANKKRKLAAEAHQREQDAAAAERKRLRDEVSRELTAVADALDLAGDAIREAKERL